MAKGQIKQAQVKIDKKAFENLCGIQCTEQEIADFFSVSVDTINRWCNNTYDKNFAEVYREKKGVGKVSLRRTQYEMSKKNATMSIWLGKQYLGQTDKLDTNASITSQPKLKIEVVNNENLESVMYEEKD